MNYKLAKQLKDAGFNQGGWSVGDEYYIKEGIVRGNFITKDLLSQAVKIPTLSKLIEACGDDFQFLSKKKKGEWWAIYDDGNEVYGKEKGKTPEEAVAKLFIKLNKK